MDAQQRVYRKAGRMAVHATLNGPDNVRQIRQLSLSRF